MAFSFWFTPRIVAAASDNKKNTAGPEGPAVGHVIIVAVRLRNHWLPSTSWTMSRPLDPSVVWVKKLTSIQSVPASSQ